MKEQEPKVVFFSCLKNMNIHTNAKKTLPFTFLSDSLFERTQHWE